MKKLFAVVMILVATSSPLKAQTVFPSFADNPEWNVLECFWFTCSTQTYQFVYDTVFCNQTYSKIDFDTGEDVYLRTNNLQTMFRTSVNCSEKEYLLYDYSIGIGDTAYVGLNLGLGFPNDTTPMVLMQIDTVNYFGIDRQRFKMSYDVCNMGFMGHEMYWIRGIGSNVHPFYSIPCLCDFCEGHYNLLCYDSSTTQLYQDPFYNTCDTTIGVGLNEDILTAGISIYPNPFLYEAQIVIDEVDPVSIKIYNTSGQLIQFVSGERKLLIGSNFYPGIYFMEIQSEKGFSQHKLIKL